MECLGDLENYMQQCYDERRDKIKVIENMPSSELTKGRIDVFLNQIREINDKANAGYDTYIENLIELKKNCLEQARDYIESIKALVKHYNADLGELSHEDVFRDVLEIEYQKIDKNQNEVI
jgi:hypothetical protein